MPAARTITRRVVSVAASLGVIAVFHEFGVKYAEQMGWYDNLPAKVETAMNWLVALSEPLWFKLLTTFLVGAAVGMWVDAVLRNRERQQRSAFKYVDTRLRIRRDLNADGHVLESHSNIRNWQQVYTSIGPVSSESGVKMYAFRNDLLSIIFEEQIPYSRPIIDTFGAKVDGVQFFPMDTSGHVISLFGLENVGLFEVWFPPPNYYDARRAAAVSPTSDPLSQPLQDTGSETRP